MRKILHKIHLWLAIPLGLIVFIICLTGAVLVFQNEIDELINPDYYFAKEVVGEPMPVVELVAKVNSQLPENTVASVQVPSDAKRNYTVRVAGDRSSIYVDPYTGEIKGRVQRGGGFTGTIMQLHRWLLSRDIGKPIVGYTTLLFVIILISGIVIWWPKTKRQLKNRVQIKTKNGWWRFWYDLHISAGMYVFIGLLVLSLTGLTYSFSWYSKAFYGAFGVELPNRQGGGHGGGGRGASEQKIINMGQWQAVLDKMKFNNPDYRSISMQDGTAIVAQNFTFGNSRASDRFTFDPHTGNITGSQLYKDQDKSVKVRGWVYSLHVGTWGGLFSKILTCIIALIGASLPITGYYIYFKRHRKKKKKTV